MTGTKLKSIIVVVAAIALLATAACAVQYPTVTSTWTYMGVPSTYEFTYTVMVLAGDTYNFGYLQADTNMPTDLGVAGWIQSGPFVSNVDQDWFSGLKPGWIAQSVDYTSAYWTADWDQEILKGTTWTGVFKLKVPNCMPSLGDILTKDGVSGSANITHDQWVPMPVAEPSGVLFLASGALGAAGILNKRRFIRIR